MSELNYELSIPYHVEIMYQCLQCGSRLLNLILAQPRQDGHGKIIGCVEDYSRAPDALNSAYFYNAAVAIQSLQESVGQITDPIRRYMIDAHMQNVHGKA